MSATLPDTTNAAPSVPGWAIWLTGLPASGKSTVARRLQERLRNDRITAVLLDSDALRPVLAPAAGYDEAGRLDFYTRLTGLAHLLVEQGVPVILAATANRRAYRDAARACLPRFMEIWVNCPVEVCRARDQKGLYARAQAGSIQDFPGVNLAYEAPLAPEVTLDSAHLTAEEAAEILLIAVSRL